jgi:pyruvate,water dikinase
MTSDAASFPVPDEFQGEFLQWDKMHCPRPQTPMTQDLFIAGLSAGFSGAMDEFGCPIGLVYRTVNSFGFIALPLFEDPPSEERLARYGATMETIVPHIGRLWEEEWLPSIMPGIERAKSDDYGAMSDEQLLAALERMREEFVERYVVHGKINFILVPASGFADFYVEHLGPDDPTEPYQVLQGFPTKSLDAGRGLWKLRGEILANDDLRTLFETREPDELSEALQESDAGRTFRASLQEYLEEFGWRTDAFEMAAAPWRDDPSIPLNTLQGYIALGEDQNPDAVHERSVARREELLGAARAALADRPELLAQFDALYESARGYLTVTEDHNFWIDQVGNNVLRLPVVEIGQRLADRGTINDVSDVFMLRVAELSGALDGASMQAAVDERRADLAHWAGVIPPPILGEPPPPSGDPLEEGIFKMFGTPVEPSTDPNVITGLGASAGTVQGPARVVRDLSEASKVKPGDILVCEMTMPAWTPLFSTVAAVVADTGGRLSHCAIVSREYGLPCVVGTAVGTAVIEDGMILTVDGSAGVIRIDER